MIARREEITPEEQRDRAIFFRTLLDKAAFPILAFAAFIGAAAGLMGCLFSGMSGIGRGGLGARSDALFAALFGAVVGAFFCTFLGSVSGLVVAGFRRMAEQSARGQAGITPSPLTKAARPILLGGTVGFCLGVLLGGAAGASSVLFGGPQRFPKMSGIGALSAIAAPVVIACLILRAMRLVLSRHARGE